MKLRDDAWVIADTHFGHSHIIDYANRPFSCVAKMDDEMIHNWNSVVTTSDQVLFLGDFASSSITGVVVRDYFKRLNGRIILLLGNHDRQSSADWWRRIGFQDVIEHPIIYESYFILSHEPVDWVSERLPILNIHGHIHEKTHYNLDNNHYNVSVENIGYTPVRLQSILEKGRKLASL
jgi:calcineurin-like phosphoesterase family protein